MRRSRAFIALACAALAAMLGGCATAPPMPLGLAAGPAGARAATVPGAGGAGAAAADAAMRSAPDRYVVVTVRNPLTAPAARAASTPRGYDGAPAYGVGASARRAADAVARERGLRVAAEWPIAPLGVHCLVYRLPDGVDRATELAALARDPRVESVQPLGEFATLGDTTEAPRGESRTRGARDDPYRPLQRNLDVLGIDAAHAVTRGRGVRIAIVDTAVDVAHPDLAGARILARDGVGAPSLGEIHGTQVLGAIGAIPRNGIGIAGIAPEADLLAVRACWNRPGGGGAVCNSFTLARALVAAIDSRADVVNLSLGGPADPLLERLVRVARGRGAIVVGAVAPGDPEGAFAARVPGVIAVGEAGRGAGRPDDVAAPGEDVLTLVPNGGYDFASGSSLATAEVSGVVALLLGARPHLRPTDVLAALQASAPLPTGTTPARASVNACRALVAIGAKAGCPPADRVVDAGHAPHLRTAER